MAKRTGSKGEAAIGDAEGLAPPVRPSAVKDDVEHLRWIFERLQDQLVRLNDRGLILEKKSALALSAGVAVAGFSMHAIARAPICVRALLGVLFAAAACCQWLTVKPRPGFETNPLNLWDSRAESLAPHMACGVALDDMRVVVDNRFPELRLKGRWASATQALAYAGAFVSMLVLLFN